jgi:hypothetical protein
MKEKTLELKKVSVSQKAKDIFQKEKELVEFLKTKKLNSKYSLDLIKKDLDIDDNLFFKTFPNKFKDLKIGDYFIIWNDGLIPIFYKKEDETSAISTDMYGVKKCSIKIDLEKNVKLSNLEEIVELNKEQRMINDFFKIKIEEKRKECFKKEQIEMIENLKTFLTQERDSKKHLFLCVDEENEHKNIKKGNVFISIFKAEKMVSNERLKYKKCNTIEDINKELGMSILDYNMQNIYIDEINNSKKL